MGLFLLGLGDVALIDVVLAPRLAGQPAGAHQPAAPVPQAVSPSEIPVVSPPSATLPLASTPTSESAEAEIKAELPPVAPLSFRRNEVQLGKKGRATLAEVVQLMRAQPELRVVLTGHTDDWGTPPINQRLSTRRARVAAHWLQVHGVEGERIEVVGRGAAQPLDSARNALARAKNRRVDFDWRWEGEK